MNGAQHGVVLVAFGSVLKSSKMSEENRIKLVTAFGKLRQRVIWKWETETMPDLPSNVKLSKWLPQEDVLGHPKLRLFVTHGGQSSFQEALCHKRPVVSLQLLFLFFIHNILLVSSIGCYSSLFRPARKWCRG